ncbi:MAG: M48 family metallopeptidase [Bacteroidia bacterium]|nr:M48 family metallopeptidase [Bacteroidia bacterium]
MKAKGIYQTESMAVDCDLKTVNGSLYIQLKDQAKNLVIWDLRMVTSCNFEAGLLTVTQAYPKQLVSSSDPNASFIFEEYVAEVTGKKKIKRRTNIFAAIILFALGVVAFAWFVLIPWLAEKAASFISVETEISLGKSLGDAVSEQSRINDSASYYIQKFVNELVVDDTYPLEVKVVESEEVNAFALPGGKIFVYSGILEKMDSYKELTALLGHEISHVTNRHSLKAMSRGVASSLVLSSVFGDAGGLSVNLISKVNEFKSLDYSRDLETEADNEGLQVMLDNEVDPQGMVNLLKLLKSVNSSEPYLMKYLSTHPDTDSRIDNVVKNPDSKREFGENEKLKTIFEKIQAAL